MLEDLTKQLEASPLYQEKMRLQNEHENKKNINSLFLDSEQRFQLLMEIREAKKNLENFIKNSYTSELSLKEIKLAEEQQTLDQLNQILEISKKPADGAEHSVASFTAGKDINIIAKQGILLEGTNLTSSNGGMTIYAAGNLPAEVTTKAPLKEGESWIATTPVQVNRNSIVITSLADTYQYGPVGDANSSYHQLITNPTLTAKKDIQIVSEGKISTNLDTKPTIVPTGKLLLDDKLEVYDNTAIKFNPQTEMLSGTDLKIVKVPTGSTFVNNAMILNGVAINSQQGNVLIHNKTGDIQFAAAQEAFLDNSRRTYKKGHWWNRKKITETKHSQISDAIVTDITGNNINIKADGSIYAFGTQMATNNQQGNLDISAGKKLYLYTVDSVNEQNVDVKKKSTFLGIKYSDSHTNDTRNETVELPAKLVANKIITQSGQNTYLKGTQFEYLSDVTVQAGVGKYADPKAQVIFDNAVKQIQTSTTKESNNTLWMVKEGEGGTTTTATLPSFVGPTKPQIIAPGGLVVIVGKDADKTGTVTDKRPLATVAVELSKQPGFEYLADIAKREDVDWQQIKLIQDKWEYKQEGLTPAAAALIALAVSAATGGAGTAAMLGVAQGSAAHAAFISLASKASVTLINNKGDVAKTLKDLGTSATVKELAFAAVTAGVSAKLDATVLKNVPNKALGDRFIRGIVHGTSDALLDSAVNGTSLEEALKRSLRASIVDAGTGYVFKNAVKGLHSDALVDNIAHKLAAGLVGCASAELNKQSCEAGALGAAVGEMVADYMVDIDFQEKRALGIYGEDEESYIENISQLTAASVALLTGIDVNTASTQALSAAKNNALSLPALPNWVVDATAGFGDGIFTAVTFGAGDLEKVRAALGSGGTVNKNSGYYIVGDATGQVYVALIPVGGGAQVLNGVRSAKYAGTVVKQACFTKGTLVETIDGLKPIEQVKESDLVWSRHESTFEYDYKPVVSTAKFQNKQIYEVTVQNEQGQQESYQTTEEHPFWVDGSGWIPASALFKGMKLVDRNNKILRVVSQTKLEIIDTVYNFTVDEYHTYHVGKFGTWVHNECSLYIKNIRSYVTKTGRLHKDGDALKQEFLNIGYNKNELIEAKQILERSIIDRKSDKLIYGELDAGHKARIALEEDVLKRINNMLKEF